MTCLRPALHRTLSSVALLLALGAVAAGCGGSRAETKPNENINTQEAVAGPETIRKQVYDLRPADLEQFPIWEHALGEEGEPGQDEATVKPRPDLAEADPGEGMFIVRAEFVAHDGTRYDGYVYPGFDFDLGYIQPTIVTDDDRVSFWYGSVRPKPGEIEKAYKVLGKTADQLFPVSFRAVAKHDGAKLEGEVPAFLYLKELGSDEVVQVK